MCMYVGEGVLVGCVGVAVNKAVRHNAPHTPPLHPLFPCVSLFAPPASSLSKGGSTDTTLPSVPYLQSFSYPPSFHFLVALLPLPTTTTTHPPPFPSNTTPSPSLVDLLLPQFLPVPPLPQAHTHPSPSLFPGSLSLFLCVILTLSLCRSHSSSVSFSLFLCVILTLPPLSHSHSLSHLQSFSYHDSLSSMARCFCA